MFWEHVEVLVMTRSKIRIPLLLQPLSWHIVADKLEGVLPVFPSLLHALLEAAFVCRVEVQLCQLAGHEGIVAEKAEPGVGPVRGGGTHQGGPHGGQAREVTLEHVQRHFASSCKMFVTYLTFKILLMAA